jgi:hypothetical protein
MCNPIYMLLSSAKCKVNILRSKELTAENLQVFRFGYCYDLGQATVVRDATQHIPISRKRLSDVNFRKHVTLILRKP